MLLNRYRSAGADPGRMWQLVRDGVSSGPPTRPFMDPALLRKHAEQMHARAIQAHELRQPAVAAQPIGGGFRLGAKARSI